MILASTSALALLATGMLAASTLPPLHCAALAYVGPAGIGALGVLLIVVIVLLIGAVGLVLYPLRLLLSRRRRLRQEAENASLSPAKNPSVDKGI